MEMAAEGKSKKRVPHDSDSEFMPDNHTEEPPTKKQNVGRSATHTKRRTQKTKTGPMPKPAKPEVVDLSSEPEVIRLSNEAEVTELQVQIKPKRIYRPGTGFPRWKDGDVSIQLKEYNPKYSYQLHSATLARASSWFAREMSHSPSFVEPSQRAAAFLTSATNVAFRFELIYDHNVGSARLVRMVRNSKTGFL